MLNDLYGNKEIALLDFACGTGRITEFLEDKVNYSTGVDVSESMLKIARKKLKLTKIIKADLTKKNILIGTKYNLTSESKGEGINRSVSLIKTEQTEIPENIMQNNVIDRGIEIFYSKPGTEIVLRKDGSFGIAINDRETRILDRRPVEDGEFRIRQNKIVCRNDSNW